MFVSKAGAYKTGAPYSGGSNLTDIRLPWKILAREKHSSLLCGSVSDEAQKSFTILTPGCTARAYPSEVPFRCSTLGLAPGLAHKH
jgi:hypothetical protein